MTGRIFVQFVRIWLSVIVTTAGVLVMVIGRDDDAYEGGAAIIGAGLSIWFFNVLLRMGFHDPARDEEDEARAYFDRHGHWPDEAPPGFDPDAAPEGPRTPHKTAPPAPTRHRTTVRGSRPRRPSG